MDMATKLPHVIALVHHTTVDVAETVLYNFTSFGFCEEILSDLECDLCLSCFKYFCIS
jgi:hypothetical protein